MSVNIALFDDLDAVAADAAGALDRAAQPRIYDRLDWYRLIAAHCAPEGRLTVVRARDGERAAWLFLAVSRRTARAFGAWYSLRFDAVGDRDADLIAAISGRLREAGVSEVALAPIEDPLPLLAGFGMAGWAGRMTEKTGNWHVDLAGRDFAAYWADRPGQLRSTAKRRAKAAGLDIAIHDRFDEAAWADYLAVYRSSWKPEEGSFAFLEALARQEGAAGTLRLGVASKDGRPVAVQLWLVENGEATIHKLAYAEDAKEMSPGTILGEAMFRRVIDTDRVRTIDYGTGDDGYKKDWMEARRPLFQLVLHDARTLRGRLGASKARASALVARLRSR